MQIRAVVLSALTLTALPVLAQPNVATLVDRPSEHVTPVRVARAVMTADGPAIEGEWQPYDDVVTRSKRVECLFDSMEVDWTTGGTTRIGADLLPWLSTNAGDRIWPPANWRRSAYCEDMQKIAAPGEALDHVNTSLLWDKDANSDTSGGNCVLFYMFYDDVLGVCSNKPSQFVSGVAIDLGFLPWTIWGYDVTATGLQSNHNLNILFPSDGDGSYYGLITLYDFNTNTYSIPPGPCATLYWSTSEDLNAQGGTTAHRHGGAQDGKAALDDWNPMDWGFDVPAECMDFGMGWGPGSGVAHANAFGYWAQDACPPGGGTPFTKFFAVTGTGVNTPWSYRVKGAAFDAVQPFVSGVTGTASQVAIKFSSDINALSTTKGCWPKLNATFVSGGATNAVFAVTTNPGAFDLFVGPVGTPWCKVTTSLAACNFNPDIEELELWGTDCNANGLDDSIDLFTGTSDDANLNGILDECERCPTDFNQDGFVTGDDFDGYVAAFELGDDSADFNTDGFVTGDDFDAFVEHFEAGC